MADDEEEWRFSVDEVGESPQADPVTAEGEPADDEDGDDASVAGEFAPQVPVVPQRIGGESALFITLGAILAVLGLVAVFRGPAFGLMDVLVVTLVVGAIGGAIYAVLVHLTPETPESREDAPDTPDT